MIALFVPGIPATKGSARAFMPTGARFPIVTNDNPNNKAWASRVSLAAAQARGDAVPIDGAVSVELEFRMPRLASHLRKDGSLKPSAPARPIVRPDVDKLVRSVLDALRAIAYRDDASIVELVARKVYASLPGVQILVRPFVENTIAAPAPKLASVHQLALPTDPRR